MTKAANDNEPTWQTLAAATARVLVKLNEKCDEQRESESNTDRTDEQKRKANSDYVAERVRDIEAFERRAGRKN
jgi:hypothetical protein